MPVDEEEESFPTTVTPKSSSSTPLEDESALATSNSSMSETISEVSTPLVAQVLPKITQPGDIPAVSNQLKAPVPLTDTNSSSPVKDVNDYHSFFACCVAVTFNWNMI